jgi:phage tail-like protein
VAPTGVVATPTVNQKQSLASIKTDPMRNFKFQVNIYNSLLQNGPAQFGFMSVSGLSLTTDVIVYRTGGMNTTTQKMPGQTDFSPLVLSRGLVAGDTPIWSWFQQIFQVIQGTGGAGSSDDFRCIMDILLIDHPVTTPTAWVKAAWRVENCWPISIAFSDMDSGANGLMLQQITMAHEGFLFKVADQAGPGFPAVIPVGSTS